jgi:hypothetical protein
MKKSILSICLLSSSFALFAQVPTLTSSNINPIASVHTFYVADSNASNLDAVVGAGVTWDYSTLQGYTTTVDNNILSAATAANAADFPTSVKADELEGNFMIYQNQVVDSIFAQGYTFSEPSIGDALIVMSGDEAKVMQYPFTFGNTFSDSLAGTLDIVGPTPVSGGFSGLVIAVADGHGTLLLGTNTYTNVLRIKVTEDSEADLGIFGTVDVDRVQYYYYQPGSQNFPVFIHTNLNALGNSQTVVYSQDLLSILSTAELSENVSVNIYPNPVSDQMTIQLSSNANFNTEISIKDILGKTVISRNQLIKTGNNTINLNANNLRSGVYMVNISSGESQITKKIVVR